MSTIRDVARLAGVSTATVSRIINNDTKYKITDATRNRVLEAIRTLDYQLPQNPPKRRKDPSPAHGPFRIGCVLSVTRKKIQRPLFHVHPLRHRAAAP